MTTFRELRVYRAAFDAQLEVHALAMTWPRWERFLLVSQAVRSSRGVCVNIAEAWRKRRYPAAFVAKLSDAEAEAEETRVHLETAVACGYLDASTAGELDRRYDGILAGLSRMAHRPESWQLRSLTTPLSSSHQDPEARARDGSGEGDRLPPSRDSST